MSKARIGIIGGTGLGNVLLKEGGESVHVETPFGQPSMDPILANWGGADVAFIARHGAGHIHNPSNVPYRANIWAMKSVGVDAIVASGATGSLQENIAPGHLVICDQVIDKTFRRASTYFDEGVVAHVEMGDPFCPALRSTLSEVGEGAGHDIHTEGTYVCMEGPQFSTRAESLMHRQWGGDVIGMTCMPEAKLAREAELCYAIIALPTDYDCWRPHDAVGNPNALLEEIIGNLHRATARAVDLIRASLPKIVNIARTCRCRDALKLASWTDEKTLSPEHRQRFSPLLQRHWDAKKD